MPIILAGALGATALNVLLFRRLRQLSWQLTRLRVERDCERILRELGRPAEIHLAERENAKEQTLSRIPVRSKAHLSLYRGGLVAAWLTSRRHQRHFAAAAGTAVFAAAALVAVLLTAPNRDLPGFPYEAPPGLGSSDHPLPSRSPAGKGSSPMVNSSGDEALMSADQGMSVNGVSSPSREVPVSASPSPSLATPRPPGTATATASEQPAPTHDPTSPLPLPSATLSPIGGTSLLNLCVDAGLDLDICARL